MLNKRMLGGLLGVAIALGISLIPASKPLTPESMRALGLLLGAVIWILFGFMPEFLALLSMCIMLVVTNTVPISVAFGTFSTSTWWLMLGAFGISVAASESGLVQRIALGLLKILPATFKGQVLGFIFSGLVISPIIPSSTAKAVIASTLAKSTSEALGFKPGSRGAAGLFIAMFTGYVSIALGFLSGSAVNVSIVGVLPVEKQVTWMQWFYIALPWTILSTIFMIICIFKLYEPKGSSALSKEYVSERLAALGPVSWKEKLTLIVVLCALGLWILESVLKINSAMIACGAMVILLASGTFTPASFRSKISWESLIFVGCFLCLPTVFAKLGINDAIKIALGPIIDPVMSNLVLLTLFICVLVFLIRLVIVSLTGATILVATLFLPFCPQYGIHPFIIAFIAYVSTNTWNVSYQNTTTIAALAATDNKMVTHKDILGGSVVYMITSTIACLMCIPVWKFMGLC